LFHPYCHASRFQIRQNRFKGGLKLVPDSISSSEDIIEPVSVPKPQPKDPFLINCQEDEVIVISGTGGSLPLNFHGHAAKWLQLVV
jgi:hypothetical protein